MTTIHKLKDIVSRLYGCFGGDQEADILYDALKKKGLEDKGLVVSQFIKPLKDYGMPEDMLCTFELDAIVQNRHIDFILADEFDCFVADELRVKSDCVRVIVEEMDIRYHHIDHIIDLLDSNNSMEAFISDLNEYFELDDDEGQEPIVINAVTDYYKFFKKN